MAIDLMPILNAFIASDVVSGVLGVAGTLAGVYMLVFGVWNTLLMIRGEDRTVRGALRENIIWFENLSRDRDFRRRYRREVRHREYREWKKSKGL